MFWYVSLSSSLAPLGLMVIYILKFIERYYKVKDMIY